MGPMGLISTGRLGTIGDGAFSGLMLLEYLFIEDNDLGSIAPTALRGLRGLLYLSLANNHLQTLPKGLFQGLETLNQLDLRGNPFQCSCPIRWLLTWLDRASVPTELGVCQSPPQLRGTPVGQLQPRDFQCLRTELRPFQSLPFSSLSAEPFALGGQGGVVLAQPHSGACALLEWDQLEGRFRAPAVINGTSPIACHPIPLSGSLLLIMAQLSPPSSSVWLRSGGPGCTSPIACHPIPLSGSLLLIMAQLSPPSSSVWLRSGGPGSPFTLIQTLGSGLLRRPHSVSSARLGPHWYLGVTDSSKGGTSAIYRWGGRGFYRHQSLRPWHRDTHMEFLELGGSPALVLCSGARRPLVYRWSGAGFVPHTDIPHVPDVYAAKHFRMRGNVFLCLSRFLGDAKVMRWEGSMFREVQHVPARGSLVFQPLSIGGHRYVLLGNDYAPSRVYRLGPGGQLEPMQELLAPSPRSFAPISMGHRHFLVASSFKGATQIYRQVTIDMGA
ncbi:leucine-rich glioma-inactivated protein 1-like [Melopsittacus undulatus]|uniref:leucine-rich glioma-inactivated protein 1-like n=1 Tax=Melopsittacus undulatus TaxID=13146 RepID=UPI00146E52EC|nr:leucine-rich glioma-inactivated protein 1-like [Melopsittacus undulatus]